MADGEIFIWEIRDAIRATPTGRNSQYCPGIYIPARNKIEAKTLLQDHFLEQINSLYYNPKFLIEHLVFKINKNNSHKHLIKYVDYNELDNPQTCILEQGSSIFGFLSQAALDRYVEHYIAGERDRKRKRKREVVARAMRIKKKQYKASNNPLS